MTRQGLSAPAPSAPAATALLAALSVSCAPPAPEEVVFRGEKMGTTWTVKVVVEPPPAERRLALEGAIEEALERVDSLMSHYRPDSEVSRFNAARAGEPVGISPETLEVLQLAGEVHRLSGGAFDVTVGPLVDAWGFGPGPSPAAVPGDEELAALLRLVGQDALALDAEPATLAKPRDGMTIDLSAVAKGYAVDLAAEALEARGVGRYLVEIGGELRGRGANARGQPWRVAVERPQVGTAALTRSVRLDAGAIATSGEYRNFRIVDGRRVSHTIDPRTGRPIEHRLAAVTVLDESCARADALATALNVLGPEQGRRLAAEQDLAVLFQIGSPAGDAFEERATPGFEARVLATSPHPGP